MARVRIRSYVARTKRGGCRVVPSYSLRSPRR
jgi:hypothetical protein